MTPPSSVYSEMITPKSRRLRTIGILLLLAVALMTLYGYFSLMPAINRKHEAQVRAAATSGPLRASDQGQKLTRAQRAEKLQVAVVFAYWGVCFLLVIATIFVAWLDLREVSRSYVQQRKQLWTQAADKIARENRSEGETSGGQGQT